MKIRPLNEAFLFFSADTADNPSAHPSFSKRSSNSHLNSSHPEQENSCGVIATLASLFYPGGLWTTRIRMTIVLGTITVNVFLNFIQNQLLSMAQELQNTVEYLAEPTFAFGIEGAAKLSTALETLESSRFSRIAETLGLPSSADVRNNIDTIRTHQSNLERSGQVLFVINRLLLIAGWLLWAFIGYAAIWMIADFLFSGSPYMTLFLCGVAIGLNALTWVWLHRNFGDYVLENL